MVNNELFLCLYIVSIVRFYFSSPIGDIYGKASNE